MLRFVSRVARGSGRTAAVGSASLTVPRCARARLCSAASGEGRRYLPTHEYVTPGSDGLFTVGITPYAAGALGDVVFVELPAAGTKVDRGEVMASVESVKAVGSVYAPFDLEVVGANKALESDPSLVNKDAFEAGHICKVKALKPNPLDGLLDNVSYDALLKTLQ